MHGNSHAGWQDDREKYWASCKSEAAAVGVFRCSKKAGETPLWVANLWGSSVVCWHACSLQVWLWLGVRLCT
jgi:hypothetical protein